MNNERSWTQAPSARGGSVPLIFEIFVQNGFSELELASITKTLQVANEVRAERIFKWQFVSDKPGLVAGAGGVLVRASPSIPDHGFANWMFVLGSDNPDTDTWMKRARAMHQRGLTAVFLSGAATAYIMSTKITDGAVTTHWRDAIILHETGYHPRLTNRLSEKSGNIITSAGAGSTIELVTCLISKYLASHEVTEICNHLLIPKIRSDEAEQPKQLGDNAALLNQRLSKVISIMEDAIDDPVSMETLAKQVNMSTRQIERMFKSNFDMSPARFYRKLRLKRARTLLTETQLSLVEIANATGFGSRNTFSTRFRTEFGVLPSELRAGRSLHQRFHD